MIKGSESLTTAEDTTDPIKGSESLTTAEDTDWVDQWDAFCPERLTEQGL